MIYIFFDVVLLFYSEILSDNARAIACAYDLNIIAKESLIFSSLMNKRNHCQNSPNFGNIITINTDGSTIHRCNIFSSAMQILGKTKLFLNVDSTLNFT